MQDSNETTDRPPLSARFKAALVLRGSNVSTWARERGWHPSQVWMALSGDRTYPAIVEAIAETVGESVDDVTAEIAA